MATRIHPPVKVQVPPASSPKYSVGSGERTLYYSLWVTRTSSLAVCGRTGSFGGEQCLFSPSRLPPRAPNSVTPNVFPGFLLSFQGRRRHYSPLYQSEGHVLSDSFSLRDSATRFFKRRTGPRRFSSANVLHVFLKSLKSMHVLGLQITGSHTCTWGVSLALEAVRGRWAFMV